MYDVCIEGEGGEGGKKCPNKQNINFADRRGGGQKPQKVCGRHKWRTLSCGSAKGQCPLSSRDCDCEGQMIVPRRTHAGGRVVDLTCLSSAKERLILAKAARPKRVTL